MGYNIIMIITCCSNGHVEYMKTFLLSFKKNSGLYGEIIKIYYFNNKSWRTLDEIYKSMFKKIYSYIEFIEIDFDIYNNKSKSTPHFLSLESFNQKADQVLFFDCDLIVVKNITYLTTLKNGLYMVKENHRDCFNSGMMVINKDFINENIYNGLMNHQKNPDTFGNDQAVINEYFKGKITGISDDYNCLITDYYPNKAIYHYIVKALNHDAEQRISRDMLNLWHDYAKEANSLCL